MLEEILGSRAKVKILKTLSAFPERQFQAADIAKACRLSNSRASECLKDLAGGGIVESKKVGKGFIFKLNASNYFSRIVLRMFREEARFVDIVSKDFVSKMKRLDGIRSIILFGSALNELTSRSDVDFLIVTNGKAKREKIAVIDSELTEKYGITVSSTVLDIEEIRRKARSGEEFVIKVLANGRPIYGKNPEDMIWQ